jgi:non-heme chloroperoxidase
MSRDNGLGRWVARVAAVMAFAALAACQSMAPQSTGGQRQGSFTTSDRVRLQYVEAGAGKTLVMIPVWSQTAAPFKHQIDGLSDRYHVIAIDMRGHGASDEPSYGYRIHRLSADVHEFLVAKGRKDVTLAGHSMGCSVNWGYWELYGSDRPAKIILIDQMPMITANAIWSDAEKVDAGAILDKDSLYDVTNVRAGADGVKTTEGFITDMFTKQYPRDELNWVIQQNLKMPRPYAARLLYDQIPRINIPTLVVGAKTSLVSWKSQEWVASQIKGSRVEIFEEAEGGNHFMCMENPAKLNRIVKEFIG